MRSRRRLRPWLVPVTVGVALGLAGIAAVTPAQGARMPAPADTPRVLDERRDHFLEREDGRRIARIDSRLLAGPAGPTLELTIAPLGPEIEAQPGLAAVPGTNRKSAEELTRLHARGALSAWALPDAGGPAIVLSMTVADRGTLPIRRTHADGELDLHARTAEAWIRTLEIRSAPLPTDGYRIEVRVDDEVRLRGRIDVTTGRLGAFREHGGLHRLPREVR